MFNLNKSTKKDIFKKVVSIVVSLGVSHVISNVAKATMPMDRKIGASILTNIGTVAISFYVGDKVGTYSADQLTEFIEEVTNG